STAASPLYFTALDNLFVGPTTQTDGYAVRWDVPSISTATVDYNAYYTDGKFELGYGTGGATYDTFGDMAIANHDKNGRLLTESPFLDGLIGPDDWHPMQMPRDGRIASFSLASNGAQMLPNVSEGTSGAAFGALAMDCAPPHWGPRMPGDDESNEKYCVPDT